MATEQMAQMFWQLQQLSQQLVNKQHLFQQSQEMKRQQSQAHMETLTNLGAAQVAKTTYDARDFQTKAFAKMKGFRGDETAWPDWRYKFRVEASRCFRQAAAIFVGLRTSMISEYDLRNATDLLSDGKTTYERRFGQPFKGLIIPFGSLVEYHPITAKDQSRIHQFGKKVLPGLFFGYALYAGEYGRVTY